MTLDIAEGYAVPDAEMQRPDVRALTEIACAMVGLDNDIASYHKEHQRSDSRLNLVDVIAHERGVQPADALPEAVAYRDAVLARYLELLPEVDPQVGAAARRYLGGLSAWIRGNLDWSMRTPRYQRGGRETVQVVDVPRFHAGEFVPPDGVAWWWTQPAVGRRRLAGAGAGAGS
jgi:hypothetical protein